MNAPENVSRLDKVPEEVAPDDDGAVAREPDGRRMPEHVRLQTRLHDVKRARHDGTAHTTDAIITTNAQERISCATRREPGTVRTLRQRSAATTLRVASPWMSSLRYRPFLESAGGGEGDVLVVGGRVREEEEARCAKGSARPRCTSAPKFQRHVRGAAIRWAHAD